VDAVTALASGLVSRVLPREEVLPAALGLAERLARGPGLALSMTKRLLNHESAMDLGAAIEAEALAQALLLQARDHREFYEAHEQGRPPAFEGR
jgi:enoyl-CoA hydratase/carnithine racemase